MSTTVHMYSEFDRLEIEANEDGTVWVRGYKSHTSVSLTLDRAARAQLRAALDQADAIESRLDQAA